MITLGLDPSISSYGWCVYNSEGEGFKKILEKGRWKTDASTLEVLRYMSHRNNLIEMIHKYNITQVGMETPPVGNTGGFSQEKLYALYIYNLEALYITKCDVVLFAPTQLHLLAKIAGSGSISKDNWGKSAMVNAAQLHLLDKDPKTREEIQLVQHRNCLPSVKTMTLSKIEKKGVKIQSDEADAFHAARYADRFFNLQKGLITEDLLTPSECDVFLKTHTFVKGVKKGLVEVSGILYKPNNRFFLFNSGRKD